MEKNKNLLPILLVLIPMLVYGYFYFQESQDRRTVYRSAVEDIVLEAYTEAKVKLEPLTEREYKDSEELYSFCIGMEFYSAGGEALYDAAQYVSQCSFKDQSYTEQKMFLERKRAVLDAKNVYDAAKKAEEERIAQEEFLRNINEGVPYVGMPQEYIDQTSLGKHSESYTNTIIEGNRKVKGTGYFWKKDGHQIFFAFCRYGKVETAKKQNIDLSKKVKSSTKANKSDDPYNAKDYGYASDFYEDYYDEFYDAIDAEDYWEEHYYE